MWGLTVKPGADVHQTVIEVLPRVCEEDGGRKLQGGHEVIVDVAPDG